jgi:hypothetical protein
LSTAYLITFAEYFAFYAVIVTISYRQLAEQNKDLPKKAWENDHCDAKNLLLEFGYVILDLFFYKAFLHVHATITHGNTLTGIIAGKISADIVFYFLTIVNYELLKNRGPV